MNGHQFRDVLNRGTGPSDESERTDTAPVRPHPIIDLSRSDRQPTQVMDLSRTLQLHTVRLEISEAMLAELRAASPAVASAPIVPLPAALPSLQSGDTLRMQAPCVQTLAFEVPRHLVQRPAAVPFTDTLYDGGALRDRAVQLATVRGSESKAPYVAAASVPTPPSPALDNALRRSLAAFRRSSWPKQLTVALLPLAIAGVWAMRDVSASASSAHPVASVRTPVPSTSPPLASAGVAPSPSPASTAASSAKMPSERPALEAAGRPSDPSERLALIAAFSGNKAEAAALYDRLATGRNSRTFALAARLTREDRVRKP